MLLVLAKLAHGEGNYQPTRDGKTLVWNNNPKPGDVATWSGRRDREGYAHGFGHLTWYTKEEGFDKPQLYARYWGRMVDGKLDGPVNVHAQKKTDYAIFIEGVRVTGWSRGTAPSRANARWRALAAVRRVNVEPESPAAGPLNQKLEGRRRKEEEEQQPPGGQRSEDGNQRSEDSDHRSEVKESIRDLYSERWPKIDLDDSLRLLAFPPRSLRWR